MRKTSLHGVVCGERWRSPQVDEGLVAAPEHVCLAACPKSSTCQRARRASTPCLGKTWPQVPWPPRTRTACTGGARPAAHPWPCTQHRACRARGTCGTAHVAGPRPGLCGSARAPRAGGCHDRYQYCSAQPRARPPAASRPPPRARAHTHAHARAHAHAHGAQACACPIRSPTPRVRLPTRASPHGSKSIIRATRPDATCHLPIPPPLLPLPSPGTHARVRAERTCLPASAATAHAKRRASPPAVRPCQANS